MHMSAALHISTPLALLINLLCVLCFSANWLKFTRLASLQNYSYTTSLPSFPRRIGPNYYQDFPSFHFFSLFFLHMSEVKPLDLIAGYHPGLWECVGGESERERKRGREGAKENGGGNRMTPVHTRNEERIMRAALQEPVDTVYHGPSN